MLGNARRCAAGAPTFDEPGANGAEGGPDLRAPAALSARFLQSS